MRRFHVSVSRLTGLALLMAALFVIGSVSARADTTSWRIPLNTGACGGLIAADTTGNVYVDDMFTGRIQKFTGTGTFLGFVGPPQGVFMGLAPSTDGGVYVVSNPPSVFGGMTITKYDSAGTGVQTIIVPSGTGNGQVGATLGFGTDGVGNIYILDEGSNFGGVNRVEKLSPTGSYVSQFGSTGDGIGQFDFFQNRGRLAVAPDGTVYVSDANNRIQEFAPDGSFVTSWGSTGTGPGQFGGIGGIAADTSGHVYVADPAWRDNGLALQEFDSAGNFVASSNDVTSQMMAVTTFGDDLVYGFSCTTIFRYELSIPNASLSVHGPAGTGPVNPFPVGVGQPVNATTAAWVPFGSISSYSFDFGAGTPPITGPSPTATYTYLAPGTYQVTARVTSSRHGTAVVSSAITVVSPPVNTWPPSITGSAIERKVLTVTHGGWSSSPITRYVYQWQRCDAAGNRCTQIPLGGSQNYVVTAQDVGHTMRVTEIAFNATGASRPATSPPTALVQPLLSRLSVSPGAFRAARSGGSVMSSRTLGTTVRYVLSVAASIRFTIEQVVPGRRSGHRCDPPSTRNRNGARCLRYVAVAGAFTVAGHPGKNSFRFSGRLLGRPLASGTYRLTATPSTNGRRATAQMAPFTILH